jgi:serine/threonine protein phosphatase PrpC
MRFAIYQQSAIGSRKTNQDRVGYSYSKNALVMVVADGMGGHAQGEVAAEIAVETITRRFQQEARSRIKSPPDFLLSCIVAAHRAIVSHAVERDLLECPRTTCVVCLVQNGKAFWAHSGDSRLYYYHDGKLLRQTSDHSRVQQMIDQGLLTAEAAATHPERNKVYSCLGGVLQPQITVSDEMQMRPGDTVVMSTDGFWSQIPAATIGQMLQRRDIIGLIPELIIEAEKRAQGNSDNISAVAMTWGEQDEDEPLAVKPLEEFTTQTTTTTLTRSQRLALIDEVTDDDIAKAIEEIQAAIKKVAK